MPCFLFHFTMHFQRQQLPYFEKKKPHYFVRKQIDFFLFEFQYMIRNCFESGPRWTSSKVSFIMQWSTVKICDMSTEFCTAQRFQRINSHLIEICVRSLKMGFVKDYLPVIVLVPGLVAVHYGWFLLQQNERLVPKQQQVTEQPILPVSINFGVNFDSVATINHANI